jgi:hypothetical protein
MKKDRQRRARRATPYEESDTSRVASRLVEYRDEVTGGGRQRHVIVASSFNASKAMPEPSEQRELAISSLSRRPEHVNRNYAGIAGQALIDR